MAEDGAAQSATTWPIPKFRFKVEWDSNEMSFQEVSGLDIEAQPIEYRAGNISRFAIRVYTKSPTQIAARVQVYVDVNGVYGQDPIGLVVSQSFDGGNGGGWTGFDLVPQTRLPDGVDAIAIVFPAGSGASYDPELAAVSLSEAN